MNAPPASTLAPSKAVPPTPSWRPYIFTEYARMASAMLLLGSLGSFYPLVLEYFNINTATGSWLFSVGSFAGLCVTATARFWLPGLGSLHGMKVGSILLCLGSIGLFAVPLYGLPFPLLFVALFVVSGATIMANLSISPLVPRIVPELYRSRVFAGFNTMYAAANFVAPAVAAWFLRAQWPLWQSWAVLSLLCWVVLPFVLKLPRSQQASRQAAQRGTVNMPFFKQVQIMGVLVFWGAGEILFTSRLVEYLSQYRSISPEIAAGYLAAVFTGFLVVRGMLTLKKLTIPHRAALRICLVGSLACVGLGMAGHLWVFGVGGLFMAAVFPIATDWLFSTQPQAELLFPKAFFGIHASLLVLHPIFGNTVGVLGYNGAMALVLLFIGLSWACLESAARGQNT